MPPFIFDTPHSEADVLDKLSELGQHPRHDLDINDHTAPIVFTLDRTGWGDRLGVPLLRADGRVLPVTDELTRVRAQVGLTVPAGVLLALAAIQVPAASLAGAGNGPIVAATAIAIVVILWVGVAWRGLVQHLQAAFLYVPEPPHHGDAPGDTHSNQHSNQHSNHPGDDHDDTP